MMANPVPTPLTPLHYRDLNLWLVDYDESTGKFRVRGEGETPRGSMMPDDAVCTYDPKAFWDNPDQGVGGLLGKLDRRRLDTEDMFLLGALLADLALPSGPVRNLFNNSLAALREGEGLRLRLHIESAALAQLPWEMMAIQRGAGEPRETDFLVLRREVSIVRTDDIQDVSWTPPARDRARMVVALSLPLDQANLDIDRDRRAIEEAVGVLNHLAPGSIEITWVEEPATRERLTEALKDGADVLQYSGHATFELDGKGKLVLETADGTKSDYYEAGLLAQRAQGLGFRLAVLNACATGQRNGRSVWGGVAPALAGAGVPAVVANQFDILDDNATRVAEAFYPRLLGGYSVDEAVFEARTAILQSSGLKNRDWAVPVLYLRDRSGVLFPLPAADEARGDGGSPFVDVAMKLRVVAGKAVGLKIKQMNSGKVKVIMVIDKVEKGGTGGGVEIDTMGEPRSTSKAKEGGQ